MTEIRQIDFSSKDYDLELKLREKVLREPLGLKFTPSELKRDDEDIHVGAFEGTRLQACLVLSVLSPDEIKMRQVAVDPEFQGRGLGKKLVQFAEWMAKARGFQEMILLARESAVPFYLALGYERAGEMFEEITLPHQKMRKTLL